MSFEQTTSGGRLIAAFPATGKTHLAKASEGVVDSDSSHFSWKWLGPEDRERHPDWPGNYIAHIKSELADGRTVLVSTHQEVRDALVAAGLWFVLVFPAADLQAEYRKRMAERGSPSWLVEKVIGMWDEMQAQMRGQAGCDYLILGPGRYLGDVFR